VNVSPQRRREILDALRRGTVPSQGLDVLAVGLDRFAPAFDEDLDRVASGGGAFKAIRGEYGAGKTFLTRWLAERAKARGFAASEVQISETDTPPHRYQTIYRRLVEHLSTSSMRGGALRSVVDSWFFALEDDVLSAGDVAEDDTDELTRRTAELMERRLGHLTRAAPAFAAVLRAYHAATTQGDRATADGLLAWLGGQPHVAASVKRAAGVKTSRRTGRSRTTTGTPAASASMAARPKPSLTEGKAKADAAATSGGRSSSGTGPRTTGSRASSSALASQRAR